MDMGTLRREWPPNHFHEHDWAPAHNLADMGDMPDMYPHREVVVRPRRWWTTVDTRHRISRDAYWIVRRRRFLTHRRAQQWARTATIDPDAR